MSVSFTHASGTVVEQISKHLSQSRIPLTSCLPRRLDVNRHEASRREQRPLGQLERLPPYIIEELPSPARLADKWEQERTLPN